MPRTQTPWTYQGKPFKEAPPDCIGFLYLITNNHPEVQRYYLGRKFMWFKFNTKTLKKQSDWRTYKGSSKSLLADIEKYGEEHFTFEVTQLFKTRGGLVAGELESLWAAQVLYATKEDGTKLYYNDSIGNVKFVTKEHLTPEHREKLRRSWTQERREQRSIDRTGQSHSPETLVKMSEGWTSEQRNKQAKRLVGKPRPSTQTYSDEQILQVLASLEAGCSRLDIAEETGIKISQVYAICRLEYPRYQKLHAQLRAQKTGNAISRTKKTATKTQRTPS
jgi:hypothetical protein